MHVLENSKLALLNLPYSGISATPLGSQGSEPAGAVIGLLPHGIFPLACGQAVFYLAPFLYEPSVTPRFRHHHFAQAWARARRARIPLRLIPDIPHSVGIVISIGDFLNRSFGPDG